MSRLNNLGADITVWIEHRAGRFLLTAAVCAYVAASTVDWLQSVSVGDLGQQGWRITFVLIFLIDWWWVSKVVNRLWDKFADFFG